MPPTTDTFPATMRALRAYRAYTLRDLARALAQRGERGLGYATLRAIEAGERPTSPSERKAILGALAMPERLSSHDLEDALWAWDATAEAGGDTQQSSQPQLQDLAAELARLQERVLSLTRAQPHSAPSQRAARHGSRSVRRQR